MTPQHPILNRFAIGLLLTAAGLLAYPSQSSAQDLATQIPALKWIPADAGSYSAMLRNKEQLDIILGSKAWSKLNSLPAAKMLRKKIEDELGKPGNPLQQVIDVWNNPAAAEALSLLGALFADEIFVYTDRNNADFLALLMELSGTSIDAVFKGNPQELLQNPDEAIRRVLQVANDNVHRLKFPDNVIGFRVGKEKAAKIAKILDDGSQFAGNLAPPPVRDRLKKVQVHGNDVHTITLDGQLIPWEMIPINRYEDQPGQFKKLVKHLKELKLTIALGVRDEYVLLSFGEGTGGLKALGTGPRLIDRAELAPLAKFADRRLTSIGYLSKEFQDKLAGKAEIDDDIKSIKELLKDTDLTAAQKAKILKDVKDLYADIKRFTPKPGAQLSFAFMTAKGSEGYDYDWSTNLGLEGTKPLTIINYLGGEPIAFGAGRSSMGTDGYDTVVKWIVKVHEYFETFGLPRIPDDEIREKYHKFMKDAKPLFIRLDKATSKMLIPSLDGQAAIVLDGKLKINLPVLPQAMPVPELGIVIGLRDPDLFRKALQEYREVVNGLMDIVAKLGPAGGPDFKIPVPSTKKTAAGTLYYYPVPEFPGLDPQIVPTAGISENVAVFSLSASHSTRLMTKTPLKTRDGSLVDSKRPLVSAGYLSWAGLVDAATPWVDEGLRMGRLPNDVVEQVQVGLELLKVFRSVSSVTYLEQGAVVTHSESIFRDLGK